TIPVYEKKIATGSVFFFPKNEAININGILRWRLPCIVINGKQIQTKMYRSRKYMNNSSFFAQPTYGKKNSRGGQTQVNNCEPSYPVGKCDVYHF
ncbi:hypothetical protein, partial [Salmonella sp. s51090]|uniref:hypothetical protein n=1 Tax=Salmonella sp. s51090 TaxID=3159651 RepID=UPI003980F59B